MRKVCGVLKLMPRITITHNSIVLGADLIQSWVNAVVLNTINGGFGL